MSSAKFQSNMYGFDFLRSEHTLSSSGTNNNQQQAQADITPPPQPTTHLSTATTDLEKQFDVIQFLQAHRSSGCLPPEIIYKSTGIDLSEGGKDEKVAQMLVKNSKIRLEEVPDPENPSINILTFGYQAKFSNIHDKTGLLAQINRCKNGVSLRDLSDAYIGVENDLAELITAGDVLAVANPEAKDKTLFPRGEPFLVELDGNLFAPKAGSEHGSNDEPEPTKASPAKNDPNTPGSSNGNSSTDEDSTSSDNKKNPPTDDEIVLAAVKRSRMNSQQQNQSKQPQPAPTPSSQLSAPPSSISIIGTDIDPRKQIRRGEAVWISGQWFRVSSAVREGLPLSEQPARAQAPPSVVLLKNLSKKNDSEGYIKPFTHDRLPIDAPLPPDAATNLHESLQARERYAAALHKIRSLQRQTPGLFAPPNPLSNHAVASSDAKTALRTHHHHSTILRRKMNANRNSAGSGGGGGGGHETGDDAARKIREVHDAANHPALGFRHARRHGCTRDVREMYLSSRADVPMDETELFRLLIKTGLLEEGEAMRRKKMIKKTNVDNDGKPKKRRYYVRKNQKFMNTHLQGTEIGAALARAAEMQAQGKSVGDGGM